MSSSFLHRYQANGFSHPVTKTALPDAETYVLWKKRRGFFFYFNKTRGEKQNFCHMSQGEEYHERDFFLINIDYVKFFDARVKMA